MLSLEDLRDKYAKELIGGKCSFIQRKGDYKVRGGNKEMPRYTALEASFNPKTIGWCTQIARRRNLVSFSDLLWTRDV